MLYGFHLVIDGIYIVLDKNYTKPHSEFHTYIIISIPYLVASIYLLKGAPHILRFCYPEETPQPPRKEV